MSFLLFIGVLVVLIVIHELGHFFVAKAFGVRVDEFGVGYPPRAFILGTWGETTYTLNWLPFGGFVKIYGEDLTEATGKDRARSMAHKPWYAQVLILVAGVMANVLLAWILFSVALYSGAPVGIAEEDAQGRETKLIVSSVIPASPADAAGLKSGDVLVGFSSGDNTLVELLPSRAAAFIQEHPGADVSVSFVRGKDTVPFVVDIKPSHGVNAGVPGAPAIGVRMALISDESVSLGEALWQGAHTTIITFVGVIVGLVHFIQGTFSGSADWSSVAGPVGIASLIGDASAIGFVYLLQFTAFISVNLAVINLIPIPALDGGRIVFVLFEALFRRPLPQLFATTVNALGFLALIALMLVVTYHDIVRLFS